MVSEAVPIRHPEPGNEGGASPMRFLFHAETFFPRYFIRRVARLWAEQLGVVYTLVVGLLEWNSKRNAVGKINTTKILNY
jgi:hypothetical protein